MAQSATDQEGSEEGRPPQLGVRGYYSPNILQISQANLRILVRIFSRLSSLGAALTAELVGQVQRKGTMREDRQ